MNYWFCKKCRIKQVDTDTHDEALAASIDHDNEKHGGKEESGFGWAGKTGGLRTGLTDKG